MEQSPLSRYNRSLVAILLTSLLLWGVLALLSRIGTTVGILLLAIALSYALSPLISFYANHGASRAWAIFGAYLTLIALVVTLIGIIVPLVIHNLATLATELPRYVDQARRVANSLIARYERMHLPLAVTSVIRSSIASLSSHAQGVALVSAKTILLSTFNLVTWIEGLFLAFVISIYLLKDQDLFREKFLLLFPIRNRREVRLLLDEMNATIEGFIQGQLIVMAFVAVSVTLGLLILGIPYAFLFGFLAGFLEVVPYLGAIVGAVPAVLVALFISPLSALFVLLLFVLINQIEGHIVVPSVVGHRLRLPPLSVILALLIGAEVRGMEGMMLAVPVAAILRVGVNFSYRKLVEHSSGYDPTFPTRVFCPSCHQVLEPQWVVCPHCGFQVRETRIGGHSAAVRIAGEENEEGGSDA